MIETEQVAELVERHGVHGVVVERAAVVMVHGEDDVGVGDPPVVIARPPGAAADGFLEVIDERHVDVGACGVAA